MSSKLLLWLEASTFSNRGEMRQQLSTDWKIIVGCGRELILFHSWLNAICIQ